ncbi:MAG: alpha/beta hydrolase [Stellaceae bacterium]
MLWPVLGGAALGYGAIMAALFALQRRLLYHPDRVHPNLAGLDLAGVREVTLRTRDGLSLFSWYRPPFGKRPVIVYFHGNGGHIGYRADRLLRLASAGYGVLLTEYRGYGGNPGRPSERGLYLDAEAALDFLGNERIASTRLVLWGESLGTGPAVYLASRHRVGAVVLEAPFTSITAAARYHYPWLPVGIMLRDRFDSLSRIGRIGAPLLVLHGEQDRLVPARMGRALLAAAAAPKEGWFAPRATHKNLAQFGASEVAAGFIERWLAPRREPAEAVAKLDGS